MGYLLKSGEVGNIGLKHQKVVRESTVNKWDSLGFLEGLEGHVRENIALLYENQASTLINETTDAGSSGSFETVVFPIVRRVFSKLLANDIVSVQAMNLPIGKLFYFVPKVSDRIETAGYPTTSGSSASHGDMVVTTCITDNTGCDETTYSTCAKNLYDRFYNDGMYDQSKGKINVVATNGTPVIWTACSTGSEFTPGVTAFAGDGSVRTQILQLNNFTDAGAGRLTGPDGNEMDSEEFLASLMVTTSGALVDKDGQTIYSTGDEVPVRVVTQRYGKGIVNYNDICTADGTIYLEVDLTHPKCITCSEGTFDGYIGAQSGTTTGTTSIVPGAGETDLGGVSFVVTYRRYDDLELESQMGEVSFELDSVTVSVTERKLRATWTPELAQDVSAFHNIDAEAELTALLSEQVAAEIDREILRDLRTGAAWQLKWDYNGWKRLPNNNGYTQKDWNQTLVTAVNQISAQIHKSTLRGGANFVVVSSEVSAIFDDLEYFHVSNASPEQDNYNMGIERVGSLSGRYTVYRDPYAPSYSVLIGHKGKSLLDTGYIYAPYVPLQLTPTMYNPFNFVPVKGIMTRYAKKMVNNRFYGHIRVDGLRTFDVRELR
jgi:hypothetical protein